MNEYEKYWYEERAAILEYMNRMKRPLAEATARRMLEAHIKENKK